MSEAPNPGTGAESKPEAKPGAATPATAKPVPSPLFLWIGVATGALVIGGVVGAVVIGPQVIAMHKSAGTTARPREAIKPASDKKGDKEVARPVVRVDNVIVNPAGSQGSRFLLTSVAIELPDAKTQDWVRAHDAEVRDVVITTLERQSLEQLTQAGARDSVKRALTAALQPVAGTTDLRVYLPQFVIQ